MPDLLSQEPIVLIHFGELGLRACLFRLDLCDQPLLLVAFDVQDPLHLRRLRAQFCLLGLFSVERLPNLFCLIMFPPPGCDLAAVFTGEDSETIEPLQEIVEVGSPEDQDQRWGLRQLVNRAQALTVHGCKLGEFRAVRFLLRFEVADMHLDLIQFRLDRFPTIYGRIQLTLDPLEGITGRLPFSLELLKLRFLLLSLLLSLLLLLSQLLYPVLGVLNGLLGLLNGVSGNGRSGRTDQGGEQQQHGDGAQRPRQASARVIWPARARRQSDLRADRAQCIRATAPQPAGASDQRPHGHASR